MDYSLMDDQLYGHRRSSEGMWYPLYNLIEYRLRYAVLLSMDCVNDALDGRGCDLITYVTRRQIAHV